MNAVDISLIAAPDVVEALDFESALAAAQDDLLARYPDAAPVIALESEPLAALLEAVVYSKINDRGRVNDAAKSVMLPYAIGTDLDNIGAGYDTARLAGEDDARFRLRIQQSFHRLAAAGPANAYRQHALGVSTDIRDVDVWSEQPGQVTITVLARELRTKSELADAEVIAGDALFGPGTDDTHAYTIAATNSTLLQTVLSTLNAEDVRPLTDAVIVRAPAVQIFTLTAVLEILPGPDPEIIRTRRLAAVKTHLAGIARIGYDVTRAGLIAALVESGVKNVRLESPSADIMRNNGELAVCVAITLNSEIVDA